MLMRYTIDSSFEFCPESCQLTVFGAENIIISLNIPASRCLELLLERRFELVPQNDFYEYAWGEEAKEVSVNTLYQNIALLRRALKSISKNYQSMVLTVPKQGFKFNQIFSVHLQTGAETTLPPPSNHIEIEFIADPVIFSKALAAPPARSRWQGIVSKLKRPLCYSAITLGFIVASALLYDFLAARQSSPLSSYALYPEDSGCMTYSNSDTHDIAKRIELIQSLGVDCKTSPYLYITVFRYSTRTSAVVCPSAIESTPSPACTTFNLIGESIQ